MVRIAEACPPDIADNVLLSYMWNEVHGGKNLNVIISGLPRTGKSELALDLAWNLYRGSSPEYKRKFEIGKHVAWTKIDFQKKVRKYTDIGACLVWDEAGIAELGAHSRQFWSESNIGMSTLFQIMGFHQQICIITLPSKIMLDKHLRILSHIDILTYRINKRSNTCSAVFTLLEPSSAKQDEILTKFPRYIDEENLRYRIRQISVPRAPKEIISEYKAYSAVFKEWLESRLIAQEEARHVKNKGAASEEKLQTILRRIKARPRDYVGKRGTVDSYAIMYKEQVSFVESRQLKFLYDSWERERKSCLTDRKISGVVSEPATST